MPEPWVLVVSPLIIHTQDQAKQLSCVAGGVSTELLMEVAELTAGSGGWTHVLSSP